MNNETKVIDFFTGEPYSKHKFERHPTSGIVLGERIIDEIVKLNINPLVIDAGCGVNPFKGMFDNLIGFDIAPYPEADFQASFHQAHHIFNREFADVVFALGSCNFGTMEENMYYFDYFMQWLKPGGLCAVRVHIDRKPEASKAGSGVVHVPWTIDSADACAHHWFKNYFDVVEMHIETMNTPPYSKLAVWIWKKKKRIGASK